MKNCPRCRTPQPDRAARCLRCGRPLAPAGEPPKKKPRKPRPIAKEAWVALAVGGALAGLAMASPLLGFIPATLGIVIHELGHAATAWLLGRPALPSFDLTYGGVSHTFGRVPLLLAAIYAGFGVLLFRSRRNPRALAAIGAGLAVYSLVGFTRLHDLAILGMGHGAELLFAGVFLYRALSGSAILERLERPLYAFLGLYLVASGARFASRLMTDPVHRQEYGEAKGGGHSMDFSRIAEEVLHVPLQTVAFLFLLGCLLTPLLALLAHRYRPWIKSALKALGRPAS